MAGDGTRRAEVRGVVDERRRRVPERQRRRERRRLGVVGQQLARVQREERRLHDLIEGDPGDAALELDALRAIERICHDCGAALFGLAEDDGLILLDRFAADGADRAREAAAQVRNLTADQPPVHAMRGVEVHRLCRRVLEAEVVAQPGAGVDLHDRRQHVIAEHVAELERDAAADGRAVAAGTDRDARL